MRPIDADAVKKSIKRALGGASFPHLMAVIVGQIDKAPTIQSDEPRVIDISEIYTAKKLDVWIEDKSENIVCPLMLIETEMTNKSQTAFFYPMLVRSIKAYGKTWRCWTARPTDEQRKAVEWDAAN